jgi:uncharacterized membrane protein YhdT
MECRKISEWNVFLSLEYIAGWHLALHGDEENDFVEITRE